MPPQRRAVGRRRAREDSSRARLGPKNVLVIGASTGYGLASRIAAAWGYGAKTLGVFFERPPEGDQTATAGHYNTVAFHSLAQKDGLFAASINGDAFSDEVKRNAADVLRKQMAPVDLVIYSLASPKRSDPRTGQVHNSVLKPIGQAYTNRTIDLDSEKVVNVTLQPASEEEIADTVAVMGGDDWRRWMELLLEEKLLAEGRAHACVFLHRARNSPGRFTAMARSGRRKKTLSVRRAISMRRSRANSAAMPGFR